MLFTPRQKYRLLNWQRYERYARALGPLLWHPLRDSSGVISTNRAYAPGSGPPLIVNNPGFESWDSPTNAPHWTKDITGGSTIHQDTSEQRSGAACVRMDIDGSTSVAGIYQNTVVGLVPDSIRAGDTIRLSGWLKASAAGTGMSLQAGGNSSGTVLIGTAYEHVARRLLNAGSFNHALAFYRSVPSANRSIWLDDPEAVKVSENDGLIAGTTSLKQVGLLGINEAVLFDGATSLITIYNRTELQGLTAFTLWALFRPASAGEGDAGTLFSKAGEFELRFNSASRDLIATVHYSSTSAQRVTSTTLSADEWHTVGMRIDNSAKTPEIFVDGVEAGYASTTAGAGTRAGTTNNLIVGNNAAVSQTLHGLLDEFLLVNRPLSAGELRLLHLLSGLD